VYVKKVNKCGIVIKSGSFICTAFGERGDMNKKFIGLALVFSLLGGFLGACDAGGGGGGTGTSPSPAESPSPAATP
jgi:hypothetical protein